jgi:hypothetical protein
MARTLRRIRTETQPGEIYLGSKENPEVFSLELLNTAAGRAEHDAIVAWVKEQYKKIKNDRTKIERQWYTNLAFYYGKQNVQPIDIAGSTRLVTPNAPYWRARPITNKVRPIIRTELAKVTAQKPSASVVPASSEDADLFAAQAGEQIWDSIYRSKRVRSVLRRAAFWTLICGNGFIKDYWDPTTIDPQSGQQGDICIKPETPFHIFVPDLREEDIEGQPFVIHATTKSVDFCRLNYEKGLNGREIKPNASAAAEILDNAFLNLVGANEVSRDQVLCLEVWAKPGAIRRFPHGALITIVGDQIVQATPGWPYEHSEYPFAKLDHIPTGKFYSDSVVTDLISLQREYNRTRGQIIEAKNRMAKPQLVAPQGSLDPSKITTEPGQVILYRQGFTPPQPLPLQGLPNYVLQELDRIQSDMDDISGQHEVSKGNVPPGVTAATAISYLQEQDDTKLSHTVESIEDAMEKVAHHSLSHVVQYWDVPRMVKIVGTDGAFDTMMLKNSDLRGNTDIRMEAGSALPTSKAAKQAFIMDLMKMGFIDPAKGLEVMEIGGVQKLYDQIQVDIRQAQRENLKMRAVTEEMLMQHITTTQPETVPNPDPMAQDPNDPINPSETQVEPPPIVPVNTWDEHGVHIETHNKFRKSQAFEQLPDFVKAIFEEHVQMHKEAQMGDMAMFGGDPNDPAMSGDPSFQFDPNAVPPGTPVGGDSNMSPDAAEAPVEGM